MVAKRCITNRANVVKKSFKAHGRIPIDTAILAAIGHRFIAGLRRRARRPETEDFFGPNPDRSTDRQTDTQTDR